MRTKLIVGCLVFLSFFPGVGVFSAPREGTSNIFIEAEDFVKEGSGWYLTHNPWGGAGTSWDVYSRGFAIQGSQGASSTLPINIEKTDKYKIWLRIHLPYGGRLPDASDRSPILITIKQNGKILFEGKYQNKPWEKTDYFKSNEWRGEGYGWHWFIWECGPATKLYKGKAEITLTRLGSGGWRGGGWRGAYQSLDCILITSDLLYQPQAKDFGNPVYFRFTPFLSSQYSIDLRNNLSKYIYGKKDIFLKKNEVSPWLELKGNIGTHYSRLSSKDTFLKGKLDIAYQPEERAIVRSLDIDIDGSQMILEIPLPLNKDSLISTDQELADERLKLVKSFSITGKRPKKLIFETSFGPGFGNTYSSKLYRTEFEILKVLGINSTNGCPTEEAKKYGIIHCRTTSSAAHYFFYHNYNPCLLPSPSAIDKMNKKQLSRVKKYNALDSIYMMMFSDEVGGGKPISFYQKDPSCLKSFHQYLKNKGFKPEDFGVDTAIIKDKNYFYFLEAEDLKYKGWEIREKIPISDSFSNKYLKINLKKEDAFSGKRINIKNKGKYRIWVRYADFINYSENFIVAVAQKGKLIKEKEFGNKDKNPGKFVLDYLDTPLDKGDIILTIRKGKNTLNLAPACIDYLLLTTDFSYSPDLKSVSSKIKNRDGLITWEEGISISEEERENALWKNIKPTEKRDNPKLYYYSMLFRRNTTTDYFKTLTSSTTRIFGEKVGLCPGCLHVYEPLCYGNMVQRGLDWFDLYRRNGFSYLFSEDWFNSPYNIGPQESTFLTDLARAATKYHNQGMGIYEVLAYNRGNIATDARLRFYSYLGHGQKAIHFFHYGPQIYGGCGCDWPKDAYKTVHDLTHEAGLAEDLLVEGKLRQAKVAILYSETGDIWGDGNIPHSERKDIYYALNHIQIPVDILCEWDILNGYLNKYKILYITDHHLSNKVMKKIKEWVKNGGILWSSAGAGYYNEYNQKSDILNEVFGVKERNLERKVKKARDKIEMITLPSLDTITLSDTPFFKGIKIDTVAYREVYIPDKGKVVGTFKDGKPAAILNQYGKGTSFLIGGLPGIIYMNKALAPMKGWSSSYIPHNFDSSINSIITGICKDIKKPVELSHREIDTTLRESKEGIVVTLANYSLKPIKDLTVKINNPGRITSLISVKQGKLNYKREENSIVFHLPLKLTDFILLKH